VVAGQVVPIRFDGVEVLVSVLPAAGTESLSKLGDSGATALEAFEQTHDVIVGAAASTVGVLEKLAEESALPAKLELTYEVQDAE
jgi:hypothetical protein